MAWRRLFPASPHLQGRRCSAILMRNADGATTSPARSSPQELWSYLGGRPSPEGHDLVSSNPVELPTRIWSWQPPSCKDDVAAHQFDIRERTTCGSDNTPAVAWRKVEFTTTSVPAYLSGFKHSTMSYRYFTVFYIPAQRHGRRLLSFVSVCLILNY
jgi:hypothetical protein